MRYIGYWSPGCARAQLLGESCGPQVEGRATGEDVITSLRTASALDENCAGRGINYETLQMVILDR